MKKSKMRKLCKQLITENAELKIKILKRDCADIPSFSAMAIYASRAVGIVAEARGHHLKLDKKKPDD